MKYGHQMRATRPGEAERSSCKDPARVQGHKDWVQGQEAGWVRSARAAVS